MESFTDVSQRAAATKSEFLKSASSWNGSFVFFYDRQSKSNRLWVESKHICLGSHEPSGAAIIQTQIHE